MQNLIQLIIKYNAFFIFIILEIFCFYLIIQFNTEQAGIFDATTTAFSGWAYNIKDDFSKHFSLERVNEDLAEDNVKLFQRLEESKFNHIIEADSAEAPKYSQQYTYTAARIVNNSINRPNNYLTINRGKKHGIKKNTGVIGGDGLVGIVLNTSEHYSVIMSLLHQQSKTSVSIKNKNYFGSLVWSGHDPTKMELEAISRDANVVEGDTVVTSGYSSIFPGGIPVGLIDLVEEIEGSSFHRIRVNLSQDLNRIKHCYVITNLLQEEQKKLEATLKNE